MKKYLALYCVLFSNLMIAQYNMQDLTVYDCEGTLKDSESNALNPSWYSHDENFNLPKIELPDFMKLLFGSFELPELNLSIPLPDLIDFPHKIIRKNPLNKNDEVCEEPVDKFLS